MSDRLPRADDASASLTAASPSLAFLPIGDVIEDWLHPLGLKVDDFSNRLTGGWMFNYVKALQRVGVRPVLIGFSCQVQAPRRTRHFDTRATVWILPASRTFRALRKRQLDEPVGPRPGPRRMWGAALRNLAHLSGTPPRTLARVLREECCQAILCQEYEDPRFDTCVWLGKALGLPAYASYQAGWQVSRLERPIRPLTMRACGGLIIGAQAEINRVQARYRVPERRIARIFNPIDLAEWQPFDKAEARAALGLPSAACVVASHGRVRFQDKATDLLVDAWERVVEARPGRELRLLLIGDGHDADRLAARLEERPVPGLMWIREFVTDRVRIRRALSASDAYVMSSRLEGFPVAPIEAAALGLPVVATDAAGIPDIFEQGQADGGIVVPRDDLHALADALGRIVDDQALRRELGERARQRIRAEFSLETVGRQLRSFIFQEGAR
jgi:glycosyltransferase involved in cell wall biosynthesis